MIRRRRHISTYHTGDVPKIIKLSFSGRSQFKAKSVRCNEYWYGLFSYVPGDVAIVTLIPSSYVQIFPACISG